VVGLFSTLTALVLRLWPAGFTATVALVVGGLALVAAGTIGAILRHGADSESDMPAGFPAGAGRPDRRKPVDILGVLCVIATTSLALGVFGVFGDLAAWDAASWATETPAESTADRRVSGLWRTAGDLGGNVGFDKPARCL
jgi:hypothetical protein